MRVKIADQLYELEYNEFVRWVRAGKIDPDSLVWSRLLTDGEWRRAGDMIVFQRLVSDRPEDLQIIIPAESMVSAREEALFSLAQRRVPVLALTLILLNSIFFALQTLAGGSTNLESLITMGAYSRYLILYHGEYWRVLTHAFLHIGFPHLFLNMMLLLVLGFMLEGLYGRSRFLILYFLSALGGGFASLLFVKEQIGAGASGAIFGLMGAVVVFGIRYRARIPRRWRRGFGVWLIPFVLLELGIGFFTQGINLPAHIGGLIGGMLAAVWLPPQVFDPRSHDGHEPRKIQILVNVAVVTMLVCLGAVALHIPEGAQAARSHYVPLYEEQAAQLETLLEANSAAPQLYEELQQSYLRLRELEPKNGVWTEKLITMYRQAIERYPLSPTWYNNLAWLYVQDKVRAEEAVALAKRAVELAPSLPNQIDTLGWCYLRLGQFPESLEAFERVFTILALNAKQMDRKVTDGIARSSLEGLRELVRLGLSADTLDAFYQRITPRLNAFPEWRAQIGGLRVLAQRRKTG